MRTWRDYLISAQYQIDALRKRPLIASRQLKPNTPQDVIRVRNRVIEGLTPLIHKFLGDNYRASGIQKKTGVLWRATVETVKIDYVQVNNSLKITPGPEEYPQRPGKVPVVINVKKFGAVYNSGLDKSKKSFEQKEKWKKRKKAPKGMRITPPYPPFWSFTAEQRHALSRKQHNLIKREAVKSGIVVAPISVAEITAGWVPNA